MTQRALPAEFGKGGKNLTDGTLYNIISELMGHRQITVAGATAATKIDVAAMKPEDTLESVINLADGLDDTANCTIASVSAAGVITMTDVPTAADTVTVNGIVFTFVAAATLEDEVTIGAGEEATGDNLADVMNAYNTNHPDTFNVTSVSDGSGAVTCTSIPDGVGNGPVVTDTGTTITISSTNPGAVTATFVSAGDTDAIIVNGVTFTIKTTPTDDDLHMPVLGTDTLQAAEAVRAINAYQGWIADLDVVASNISGVVTLVSRALKSGNSIPLAESADNTTVGAAYFAGGTATGGFSSSTDNSSDRLLVSWNDQVW